MSYFWTAHRVRGAGGEDPLEGRAQVGGAVGRGVVGIVGEHLEQSLAELVRSRVGRAEPRAGRADDREAWSVREEHQEDVGGFLEQQPEVER